MKKSDSIVLSMILAGMLTVPAAVAGIVDSSINTFSDGSKAIHRFSVPGVKEEAWVLLLVEPSRLKLRGTSGNPFQSRWCN